MELQSCSFPRPKAARAELIELTSSNYPSSIVTLHGISPVTNKFQARPLMKLGQCWMQAPVCMSLNSIQLWREQSWCLNPKIGQGRNRFQAFGQHVKYLIMDSSWCIGADHWMKWTWQVGFDKLMNWMWTWQFGNIDLDQLYQYI